MTKYWATFRLTSNASYSTRYNALIQAFKEAGSNFWSEPTSFLAFDSKYDIDDIAQHLKKAIDVRTDVVLIREINVIDSRYVGVPGDLASLLHHFPEAKKV
tara:strand:- start:1029 stop:1331 length:303 start_codon:yes stop_codon:yes gene_type:complete